MAAIVRSAQVVYFRVAETRTLRVSLTLALLAAISCGRGWTQAALPPSSKAAAASTASSVEDSGNADAAHNGKVAFTKGSSAVRAKLLADTHMLLTLSRELQAEAAKSTPNTFSLRMVKKSDEIQKLAALVRAEMAGLQ